ncbi:BnaC08g02520D [Brassica napus]|uniref:(rape) hypothetical protein n=1 Tax=Brassica napus TaxID=3708 RepID=A0A078H2I1_BRANA|nr:unnamed protein product [Brassica napus]CDY32830.1 BnaC08g02520D [Brassica napus]
MYIFTNFMISNVNLVRHSLQTVRRFRRLLCSQSLLSLIRRTLSSPWGDSGDFTLLSSQFKTCKVTTNRTTASHRGYSPPTGSLVDGSTFTRSQTC